MAEAELRIVLAAFGDSALRAELPVGTDGRAVLASLRALPRVIDAVVTERHAMVSFDPSSPPVGVEAAIERALTEPSCGGAPAEHRVHVRYDGPDLADVASAASISVDEVISLHAAGHYFVAAVGFQPGFGYLRGLDPRLVVSRRPTPRPRVPALAVAIAGPYAGVYPHSSPGGWNLLGTAIGFVAFDPLAGATLALGDRVRFVREPA